jgi:hypothetical protein
MRSSQFPSATLPRKRPTANDTNGQTRTMMSSVVMIVPPWNYGSGLSLKQTVTQLRRESATCGVYVSCVRHRTVPCWLHDARMRRESETGKRRNGNFAIHGQSTTTSSFTGGQFNQCLGSNAARSGLLCRKDRRPPFGGDTVALPPLQNCGDTRTDIRSQRFWRRPEVDNVSEGAESSHAPQLRTISP